MSLPLYVAPTIFDQMNEVNAFSNAQLKNRMQELENKYYAPMADANINSLNANTNKTNTMLPLEATKMRQENEIYIPKTKADMAYTNALTSEIPSKIRGQELQNQMYVTNALSNNAYQNSQTNKNNIMTPLEAKRQEQENARYNELTDSKIAADKALSTWRATGGSGGSVDTKNLNAFEKQIITDSANLGEDKAYQIIDARLNGEETFPDGTPLPPLSGRAAQLLTTVHKRNSTAAIQNQAANADITANDINEIDITPVKKFAGLKGKINIAKEKANMLAGYPVDPVARDYLAFQSQSILAMDSLRKSFGTSVVPDYVYATIGKLSNPNSDIWNDATQVQKNWDVLTSWVTKNASMLKKKANQGATANVSKATAPAQPSASNGSVKFVIPGTKNIVSIPAASVAAFEKDHPDHKRAQ